MPYYRKPFQAENSRLTVNKNNALENVSMIAAYRDDHHWLKELLGYLENNVNIV